MSFSKKNAPKLSDRLRGKSSDELIDEIKKEFDNDKIWFDQRKPTFSTFSKAGFPFEDEMFNRDPGHVKSHLEDLAKRHPEFASNLRYPPWSGEARGMNAADSGGPSSSTDWEHAYTIPVQIERSDDKKGGNGSNHQQQQEVFSDHGNSSEGGDLGHGLDHHGLRNTVDIGEQLHKNAKPEVEGQKRSFSAPPGDAPDSSSTPPGNQFQDDNNKPKRFTSKIEITPVNPYEKNQTDTSGPPHSENAGDSHSDTDKQGSGNVRHIPIFVEGRTEPVLPKAPPSFAPRAAGNTAPKPQSKVPPQAKPHIQREVPVHREVPQQRKAPGEVPLKRKFEPSQPARGAESVEHPTQQTKPVPPQPKRLTPAQQIEEIQKDANDLMTKIEKLGATTRENKEFLFLDEMLTRNLIKLDLIEVNGDEQLRAARKNAIKCIQQCISVLESKVPSVDNSSSTVEDELQEDNLNESQQDTPMDTSTNTSPSKNEPLETKCDDSSAKGECENQNMDTTELPTQPTEQDKQNQIDAEQKESSENKMPENLPQHS